MRAPALLLLLALCIASPAGAAPPERSGEKVLLADRPAECARRLEALLSILPELTEARFLLAMAYQRLGDDRRAVRELERLFGTAADPARLHYHLGVSETLLGRPAEALAHFESAARIGPELAAPHFQLAAFYRLEGRAEEARAARAAFLRRRQLGAGDALWAHLGGGREGECPAPSRITDRVPHSEIRP